VYPNDYTRGKEMQAARYGNGYCDCCLLEFDAMVWYNRRLPAFQRNILRSFQVLNDFNWISYLEEVEIDDVRNRTERDKK
jgi:hypothetical protein